GSTWAAEKLATRRRKHVAADGANIDRELPYRLAGVEQEENARLSSDLPDLLNRLDEPAVRRDMAQGDQAHPVIDHVAQGVDRELTMLVIRHHLDHSTGLFGNLVVADDVAGVLRH